MNRLSDSLAVYRRQKIDINVPFFAKPTKIKAFNAFEYMVDKKTLKTKSHKIERQNSHIALSFRPTKSEALVGSKEGKKKIRKKE